MEVAWFLRRKQVATADLLQCGKTRKYPLVSQQPKMWSDGGGGGESTKQTMFNEIGSDTFQNSLLVVYV